MPEQRRVLCGPDRSGVTGSRGGSLFEALTMQASDHERVRERFNGFRHMPSRPYLAHYESPWALGPAEVWAMADGWRGEKTIGKATKPRQAGSIFLYVLLGSVVLSPAHRRPQDVLAICLQQQFSAMREVAAVAPFGIG
jgi:hypothetical protein